MQVHLIDINVSAEIDEYPSLHFQNIRKKPASRTDTQPDTQTDTWTDGQMDGQRENSILKTVNIINLSSAELALEN